MAEKIITIASWIGGMSDDEKVALNPGSFSFGSQLDFRHDLSTVTVLKKATEEDQLATAVYDAVRVNRNNGDIYLAGGTNLFLRTAVSNGAAGTYTTPVSASLTDVQDLDYRPDLDTLYLIDTTAIHSYKGIAGGSPALTANEYQSVLDHSHTSGTNTSTLGSSIVEGTEIEFTLSKEPIYSLFVYVASVGTGDWTVTVHDIYDKVIGTKTVANGSMATGNFEFVFDTQLRAVIGQTYHVHVTTSDATGTVRSTTTNTISTAQIYTYGSALVDGGYGHFPLQFGAKTLICNERYIAEMEYNTTYNPNRLVFASDVVATGMTMHNQYIAITALRKNSSDTLDSGINEGYLILWDGYSVFPEAIIPFPFGAPFSPISNNNVLQIVADGRIFVWAGGDFIPVYEFHGYDEFDPSSDKPAVDVYTRPPVHGSTARNGLSLFGFPFVTGNENEKVGVYSYGAIKMQMPAAVSLDYTLSTGNTEAVWDTTTTPDTPHTGITFIKNFGTNLLIGWKDYISSTLTYGVDVVNEANDSATAASYESLWIDDDRPDKDKHARSVKVTFEALPANVTVTPKIQFDRSGSWTSGTAATAGDTEAILHVALTSARHKEAKIGFDIAISSGTNKPRIISLTYKYDDLQEEYADAERS